MADYYGGRTMYSKTDECYDAGRHGSRRVYSHTDECYDDVDRRRPGAYADDCYNGAGYGGARQAAVYSDEYSRGGYGYGGEQEHFKREEREHKHKERLGEIGALAGGAFALYEGHRAKKDPEHAQRHKMEAGVATAAALGAGGYAYHEHREQKEARYEGKDHSRVPHGYYCN
ncbi:abscisic stress-ripening protein 5-like [Panicum virgatum]|uniref:Uncharacterized protein n=1 Tax=Panicum virgatum TaxID=38727 RepID=A0A8T0SX80_PANVG|nr:abscisic stress-ripening protein 5-like [Panicum virgatum]KAG2603470.1 hypothetical protein PVAP13_5KG774100 [Panicum virgatum]